MSEPLYEADIDLAPLKRRTLALIGYGNHGRSHALCLRDSGVEGVLVALREGSRSRAQAVSDGFEVVSLEDAARRADAISLLAADEAHGEIWREAISPNRRPGQALLFCHGFSVEYGLIEAPADCDLILAAPKGPGGMVRKAYEKGAGLIGFWGVAQDGSGEAAALGQAYLAALGCGRAGIFETTFREEALADILGEQAVLVGGLCALAHEGFETLVRAGVGERMAYIDTVHELKYLADLIHERGVAGMFEAISDTAEFGAHEVEPAIREAVRPVFERIAADVASGDFARRWIADYEAGRATLKARRAAAGEHPLESPGAELRALLDTKT